jgi:SAM-dependent methyltransferase
MGVWRKRRAELAWWRRQRAAEGQLHGAHYERLFTEPFGLERSFYAGRSMLDVGCGPRGSLEWAGDARERIGLDPLARRYRALGIGGHRMRYVAGRAEAIPFEDRRFDVVSAFNCLDNVEDPARAAREITRVLALDGIALLIVEVGHPPTVTEPLTLGWDVTRLFAPLRAVSELRLRKTRDGVNDSVLLEPAALAARDDPHGAGILVAKLAR